MFHSEDVWQTSVCSWSARKWYLTLNSCRAEMSWNSWWSWAKLWAVLLSTLWGNASTAYGKSRVQLQVRQANPNWVLGQLELDASETTATWIAEAMLSFQVWIWLTYWSKARAFKSRQPGRTGFCWWGSSTIAIYPQPAAYFEWLGKGNQTVHLARCCFDEAGGSTAACTLTSSTMTCAINIFVSAVQQWELGAAENKLWLPARISSLLTSDPKVAANTMLNWEEQRWVWTVVLGILG